MSNITLRESWPVEQGDFGSAGEISGKIKRILKQLGVNATLVRRIAVASYEVELNLVIHSMGGDIDLDVTSDRITMIARDRGPGIPDIEKAMREGFSTAPDSVRLMGFGAGMGLPNIKRNCDIFEIQSKMGEGTTITMGFGIGEA